MIRVDVHARAGAMPRSDLQSSFMLIVALTGNIASGKSVVASRLATHGAFVIDADVLARDVVMPGTPALDAIVARWGPHMRTSEGALDRAALRAIVFADPKEREALNALVHPGVEALRRARVEEARAAGALVVICDIPLLFETGLDGAFSCIVLVDASSETRLARLLTRPGISRSDAERMMAAQLPSESKRAKSDHVIENNGSLASLSEAADALWRTLEAHAREARAHETPTRRNA
jgi:dephospho-CoA kinase